MSVIFIGAKKACQTPTIEDGNANVRGSVVRASATEM